MSLHQIIRIHRLAALVVVTLVIIAALGMMKLNPLRQSDAHVRAWLAETTPLGSHVDDIRPLLVERGWHDEKYQQSQPLHADPPFLGGELGEYQGFPNDVSVLAFWEFDDRGRLTDIRVRRLVD